MSDTARASGAATPDRAGAPHAAAWRELERPGPRTIDLAGVTLGAGSRVVLCPRAGRDVMDDALRGRSATIEAIEQEQDGAILLAVVVEDDPGRALGEQRQIGHRFFFSPEEVAPLGDLEANDQPDARARARILVAGIGNVFLADDGFGVAAAQRLARRPLPAGVTVVDFGIRGIDLVHALQGDPDVAILLDALPGEQPPGTITVLEPEIDDSDVGLDPHSLDPHSVLLTARRLGARPGRTLVVGCEPLVRMSGSETDVVVELSPPVEAAVDEAVKLVESLLEELTDERKVVE